MSKAFKNILIIKPSALGDIAQTLPVLTALRRNFPNAEITWLVRPKFAPILADHPDLTRTILFDREYLGKAWYNPKALGALLALFYRLYRSKFDVVFDFQGLFRTAFLAAVTCCRKRFGMASARELAHIFYSNKPPHTHDCVHVVDYYLKIIQAAGVSEMAVEFKLPEAPLAADTVAELLARHNIDRQNYAVLVPSSAWLDKCWPVEHFAALADKLHADYNLSIVATGTASEARVVERLVDLAGVPVVNLAGKTSIIELVPLLKTAALVVSNDTGPGHIAAALGRPLVMIFGRSNPARVAPYGRNNCVVAVEPDGRGLLPNSFDPKHNIEKITFDQVYQAVRNQLSS